MLSARADSAFFSICRIIPPPELLIPLPILSKMFTSIVLKSIHKACCRLGNPPCSNCKVLVVFVPHWHWSPSAFFQ